ncbi:MAG TPA: nitroreductase family protein [Desulfonatronum sp.]|nr:nitroreductase family protein [Desulfonatronum sp.]
MPPPDPTILQTILERRSIREFTSKPVATEDLRRILDAGRWAPSGLNNQPWRFLVLQNSDPRKEALQSCTKYSHVVRQAAALIGVFLKKSEMYHDVKDHQAAGACIQNMLLAIHGLGLGGVWLGEIINQEADVLKMLHLDSELLRLMAFIALGHPGHSGSSTRCPLADLLLEDF